MRLSKFGAIALWDLLQAIKQKQEEMVMTTAEVKASVETLKTELTAALSRVAADVDYLKAKVVAGEASQADVDAIGTGIAGLIASVKAVDPLPDNPAPSPVA